METNRKFEPIVNQGWTDISSETNCPHPLPPPGPCPHPHGQMFQGCIAYINSYIDVRMRQLYIKLKNMLQKWGQTGGISQVPLDYILLRDTSNPEHIYKVCVTDGCLRSNPIVEIPEPEPSSTDSELLETEEP